MLIINELLINLNLCSIISFSNNISSITNNFSVCKNENAYLCIYFSMCEAVIIHGESCSLIKFLPTVDKI